jgi:hypothetical protein
VIGDPSSQSLLSRGGERQIANWVAGITAAAAIGHVVLESYLPTFKWSRKWTRMLFLDCIIVTEMIVLRIV